MSDKRDVESTKNLNRCYNVVLQSSTKGISAIDIAKQLHLHKTTIHKYLKTLEYMGKVENEQGIYRVRKGEHTAQPLEKEIVIELPMPEKQWQRMALLEAMDKDWKGTFPETTSLYRICLEKLRETRTIKIRGKNVDDLDLERLGNLVQQANEKSSLFNFKGLFKSLKRSRGKEPRKLGESQ